MGRAGASPTQTVKTMAETAARTVSLAAFINACGCPLALDGRRNGLGSDSTTCLCVKYIYVYPPHVVGAMYAVVLAATAHDPHRFLVAICWPRQRCFMELLATSSALTKRDERTSATPVPHAKTEAKSTSPNVLDTSTQEEARVKIVTAMLCVSAGLTNGKNSKVVPNTLMVFGRDWPKCNIGFTKYRRLPRVELPAGVHEILPDGRKRARSLSLDRVSVRR